MKTCKIHDLLHELCLREAQSENFLFVFPRSIQVCQKECRRTFVQSICDYDRKTSYPFDPKKVRTFIYSGNILFKDLNIDRLFVYGILSMIRVMSLGNIIVGDLGYLRSTYPTRPSYFVHLRYLSLAIRNSSAFLLIPKLHNLQTLIVQIGSFHLSNLPIYLDIWTLPQLRNLHLVKIKGSPPFPLIILAVQMERAVLEHLHTITGVAPAWCANDTFASMPNLKKLWIRFDELHEIRSPSFDLSCLLVVQGLEAVKIKFDAAYELCSVRLLRPLTPQRFLRKNIFPLTLKKLTLVKSRFSWKDMDIVGTLPNLEALKLKNHACAGNEWKPAAGGFSVLKFLSLDCIRFTKWKATDENFPVLERLCISQCWELKKIPEEFAYISTLLVIELD
ncbi:putative late blight resistance protein homolog R1B-14 [Lycium ferocissimum]|uniref:putative late blight resistance protein homolog R1B-14 n=1 Tax=Lycium ferocissimum TaxID=112874 RepID=UPI00281660ED|nr:putative late blight resistance protein homolog R1B-14 [Lycium ferocissimum]XP_059298158.1 putative late blight resistance protein homolog R1B-14 [Lycium ferocissimum]XP_059298159.1 putative late blight resistance protein homolog R1B-14 [Lycium ferocissimum]